MAELSSDLLERLRDLLLPLFATVKDRQSLLLPVIFSKPIQHNIEWEGSSGIFTTHLLDILSDDDLLELLGKLRIGQDKQKEITELSERIKLRRLLSQILAAAIAEVHSLIDAGETRQAVKRINDIAREFAPGQQKASTSLARQVLSDKDAVETGAIQSSAKALLQNISGNRPPPITREQQTGLRIQYLKLAKRDRPTISCSSLGKSYPKHSFQLRNITFDLFPGEVMALVGANASGKTTLLKILAGLIKPDCGEITYPLISSRPTDWNQVRNHVVYVDQESVSWKWTPRDNLYFTSAARFSSADSRLMMVDDYILKFDLDPHMDTPWEELTGGLRARFCLVRALLLKPKLLILDEPVSHTDPYWTYLYLDELYRLSKGTADDLSVLFSSQNIDIAESISDKLLVLDRGEPVFVGSSHNLADTFQDIELELEIAGSEEHFLATIKGLGATRVSRRYNRYRIWLSKTNLLAGTLLSHLSSSHDFQITYFRNLNYSSARLLEKTYDDAG